MPWTPLPVSSCRQLAAFAVEAHGFASCPSRQFALSGMLLKHHQSSHFVESRQYPDRCVAYIGRVSRMCGKRCLPVVMQYHRQPSLEIAMSLFPLPDRPLRRLLVVPCCKEVRQSLCVRICFSRNTRLASHPIALPMSQPFRERSDSPTSRTHLPRIRLPTPRSRDEAETMRKHNPYAITCIW